MKTDAPVSRAEVDSYLARTMTRSRLRAMADQVAEIIDATVPSAEPPISIIEWAEAKRLLPAGSTSRPGRWSRETFPFMNEILEAMSPTSPVRRIAIQKGSQIGYTVSVLENALGYYIDIVPSPILFVTADAGVSEASIQLRVDRMIETAGLQGKIFSQTTKRASKATGDTKSTKQFAGGFLRAIGSRSAAKLRSLSIRILLLDEVDGFPGEVGKEGDPVALAEKRSAAFSANRKILAGSTPAVQGTSRIERLFLDGDQRYYYVPCKACGHMQRLYFTHPTDEAAGLKFDRDEDGFLVWDSVRYVCENPACHAEWKNHDKAWFLPRGEWRPTAKPSEPGYRSYQISSLYSPVGTFSWEDVAAEWVKTRGDLMLRKTFVNTVLGESWQETGEAPPAEVIGIRRAGDGYLSETLPDEARPYVLTGGVDVQQDRIEMELVAWGKDFESWSVGYEVIEGDTADLVSPDSPWRKLRAIVERRHVGLPVHKVLVDAGYQPQITYEFASSFPRGVHAVSGDWRRTGEREMIRVSPVAGHSCSIVQADSRAIKAQFYFQLGKGRPTDDAPFPAGYCHLPADYSDQHIRQLVAEHLVAKRLKTGKTVRVWELRPGVKRNEQLDCRVYNIAAIYLLIEEICRDAEMKGVDIEYAWSSLESEREDELYRTGIHVLKWNETNLLVAQFWPEDELRRCDHEQREED